MPRNPDPFPVDMDHWNDNLFKRAHKQRFMDMLVKFLAVQDALERDEIPDFAAVMQKLEFFNKARGDRTFSERGWSDYLARFPDGTVEIPSIWLEVLMHVWSLYTEADAPVAFEKAAGMSGEGNSRKTNTKIIELTEKYNIAGMVAQHKLDALVRGEELTDDEAISNTYDDLANSRIYDDLADSSNDDDLADSSNGDDPAKLSRAKRSYGTIANAWKRWGKFFKTHAAIMSAKSPDRLP